MSFENEIKKEIRIEAGMRIGGTKPSKEDFAEITKKILEQKLIQKKKSIDNEIKEKLINSVVNDVLGYGPIEDILNDDEITEIMINGPFSIYIEKNGKKTLHDKTFDDEIHLRTTLEKMIGQTGKRIDESFPYADFSLSNGSRVNAIIPPLSVDGATITIRKFIEKISSMKDLIDFGTLSENMANFLSQCIKARLNILFSGATGSGKTTTLAVLSGDILKDERIITIEDALELNLQQRHTVRLLTRSKNIEGKGEVSVRELFKNTLRMRPSRIIIGEIRGEEALDFIQALNSGHDGTLAVLHASTPIDAVSRLETMSLYAGLNIPALEIRKQIASGLDIIVQHEHLNEGGRIISHITEVCGIKDDALILNDIFKYEMSEDENAASFFKAINKPKKLAKFYKAKITLNEKLFE